MAEWSMAADCKSVLVRVRRFESFSPHHGLVIHKLNLQQMRSKCFLIRHNFSVFLHKENKS